MFHGIDERISIDNYANVVVFIKLFIEATDARVCLRDKHDMCAENSLFFIIFYWAFFYHIV